MNIRAVQKICYGIYVIGSQKEGKLNAQIANTVFQITSDPPTMAVSINKQNLTHEFIEASKIFAVSILSQEAPMTLIGRFGFQTGRTIDKFRDTQYKIGVTGAPIVLDHTVGYMECKVTHTVDVGTHTVFIGKIIDCDVFNDAEPMTYAYYHQIKGGKSPKTAPTYVREEVEPKKTVTSEKYRCKVCGYVYDPEQGDPGTGVKPGTSFEALPDSWVCPICGAPKSEFEKVE